MEINNIRDTVVSSLAKVQINAQIKVSVGGRKAGCFQ